MFCMDAYVHYLNFILYSTICFIISSKEGILFVGSKIGVGSTIVVITDETVCSCQHSETGRVQRHIVVDVNHPKSYSDNSFNWIASVGRQIMVILVLIRFSTSTINVSNICLRRFNDFSSSFMQCRASISGMINRSKDSI